MAWLVTFLSVMVAWVFFRADNLSAALRLLAALLSMAPAGPHIFNTEPLAAAAEWAWLALMTILVLVAPNSQEIMRNFLHGAVRGEQPRQFFTMPAFRMTGAWAVVAGLVLAISLAYLPQPTSFLYFNF